MPLAMFAEVRKAIRRHHMLAPDEPVWVAVSGGIDSMVLLHVLRQLGHPCHIAHVDHGLRGKESDGDRAFVEAFAKREGLPFRSVRVDPKAAAHGASVQMAARDLRYAWFKQLLREGPRTIALGHHGDDAVETLQINLLRGMGTHGWSGIPPVTQVDECRICRPLIGVGRELIAAYAHEQGIAFREDASNADPKYLRNRVRHELLPLLEDLRPGARTVLTRNAQLLADMSALAAERVAQLAEGLVPDKDGALRIPLLRLQSGPSPRLLLMHLLKREPVHPDVIDQLLDAVENKATGATFHAGNRVITIANNHLAVQPAAPNPGGFMISREDAVQGHRGPFSWRTCLPTEVEFQFGMNTAWLDMAKLTFPLLVRPWQSGDRMRPIGLHGSKLVSDMLIDAGVPRYAKAAAFVLLSGGEPVWLAGLRLAEGFSPDGRTEKVLRLDFRAEPDHLL